MNAKRTLVSVALTTALLTAGLGAVPARAADSVTPASVCPSAVADGSVRAMHECKPPKDKSKAKKSEKKGKSKMKGKKNGKG